MYDNHFRAARTAHRTALVSPYRDRARHGARELLHPRRDAQEFESASVVRKISEPEREARADDEHQPDSHAG